MNACVRNLTYWNNINTFMPGTTRVSAAATWVLNNKLSAAMISIHNDLWCIEIHSFFFSLVHINRFWFILFFVLFFFLFAVACLIGFFLQFIVQNSYFAVRLSMTLILPIQPPIMISMCAYTLREVDIDLCTYLIHTRSSVFVCCLRVDDLGNVDYCWLSVWIH